MRAALDCGPSSAKPHDLVIGGYRVRTAITFTSVNPDRAAGLVGMSFGDPK